MEKRIVSLTLFICVTIIVCVTQMVSCEKDRHRTYAPFFWDTDERSGVDVPRVKKVPVPADEE